MNKTQIEWVKNPDGTQGYTWNPITGCLNGCPYCYARKLANGRLKERYLANKNTAPIVGNVLLPNLGFLEMNPFYPRFWPERLGQIPLFGKSLGIFACDMSDLFGIGIPESWTRRVLNHVGECQRHRFYLLTKQPQNLIKFSPFPDNCWVGVTGTNYQKVTDACGWLDNVEARVKFISIEPLLSWNEAINTSAIVNWISEINWVIIGAQTRPYKPPRIEWVREIVEACDQVGIPVFFKNNLMPLMKDIYDEAGCISNFFIGGDGITPELRQEMPEVK